MGGQFSDLDQPMSLSLSHPPMSICPPDINNFFAQPHLSSLHTSNEMTKGNSLSFIQAGPTVAEETCSNVKQVTEGSEEYTTPLGSLGKEAKVHVEGTD